MLWLWNFFLDRRQLSVVLVIVLIIAGAYAILRIPKENAPAIDLAIAVVSANLPGVTTPTVTKINFSDQPILSVSISGDLSPLEFSNLGQELSDDLLQISGVSQVQISGVPKYFSGAAGSRKESRTVRVNPNVL